MLGNTLPTVLRYQSLTLSHVCAMLAREQRTRIRELTEIFPLRVNALRDRGGGPIQITICNIRLPESGTTPPGGWPEVQVMSGGTVVGPSSGLSAVCWLAVCRDRGHVGCLRACTDASCHVGANKEGRQTALGDFTGRLHDMCGLPSVALAT